MSEYGAKQMELAEHLSRLLTEDADRRYAAKSSFGVTAPELRAVLAIFGVRTVKSLPEEHIPAFRRWMEQRFELNPIGMIG